MHDVMLDIMTLFCHDGTGDVEVGRFHLTVGKEEERKIVVPLCLKACEMLVASCMQYVFILHDWYTERASFRTHGFLACVWYQIGYQLVLPSSTIGTQRGPNVKPFCPDIIHELVRH